MKSCELCKSPAKIYCDSDQASLCWTCDSKVHSANFLVARHSRNLLCRVCQSPTPWTAAGQKLGPSAVTVCGKCGVDGGTTTSDDNDDDDDDDDVYDGDEDSETELDVDDEDEDENQVVPLSYTPPPAASSSSSDDYSFSFRDVSVKRKRVNEEAEDEDGCLSLQKDRREVFSLESNEVIGESNGGRLYNFMPLNSERMNEKTNSTGHRNKISALGLDLNLPGTESL